LREKALIFIMLCVFLCFPFAVAISGTGEKIVFLSKNNIFEKSKVEQLKDVPFSPAISVGEKKDPLIVDESPKKQPFDSCPLPEIEIKKNAGCFRSENYPDCKWQIPIERKSKGLYKIWWRTPPDELWGSPQLVKLILSSVYLYKAKYPDDSVYIGDLDAPQSRHYFHKNGVDADVYLLGWMEWIQVKGGEYADNMAWRSKESRKIARERVIHFARCFAKCANGNVQIFYNDEEVIQRVNEWFDSEGFHSPLGKFMVSHNDTHHDHFHIKIPYGSIY